MGIILHDVYESYFGFPINDVYVCVGDGQITGARLPYEDSYVYGCSFSIYATQQARLDGKPRLGMINIEVKTPEAFTGDIYDLLYTKLKSKYSSYTDV